MPHTRQLNCRHDLLALHRLNPQRYPFLLQSVAQGSSLTRYDILFSFPQENITLDLSSSDSVQSSFDFLTELDEQWEKLRQPKDLPDKQHDALPFTGGWFLYLGYELISQIEPHLSLPDSDDGLPTATAIRIPAAIIIDHTKEKTFLVSESGQGNLLEIMSADIEQASIKLSDLDSSESGDEASVITMLEDSPERYLNGVSKIKQYITEGDVFQVNLSRAWSCQSEKLESPAQLYQSLCEKNPAPFAGLAVINDVAIISSSPERLIRVYDGQIETRPIAGTRPRSKLDEKDEIIRSELLAHPKERAEHIMLIDLERNDLGRVCVPGSIEVDEMMVLETYSHVHHIVSNVRGELRDDVTPGQIIRATFPGGTITGCPKVRCMEIIAELEEEGRGAYTGSMGYLNHDGSMDLNILIRTLVHQGERISLRAGAGIVADSIAENELDETRAKARGLLLALCEKN